jgi:hypothetical protein
MRRIRVTIGVVSAAIAFCALTACQSAAKAGTAPGSSAPDPATATAASVGDGAGSGLGWSYTVTSATDTSSPDNTLSVQYPVITFTPATTAGAVLEATENAKFKNVDEMFVNLFRAQFSAPVPVAVNGAVVPSKLQVTAHANRAGRLLSVRYDAFFDRSGSASGFAEEQDLTIRTDTGASLGAADLLTPAALNGAGRTRLAALIAPAFGTDFIFGGESATSAVSGALATIGVLTNGMNDPVVAVTPTGLEFTFQQGALTPMSNGTPSAVIPFGELSGLVNPAVLALVDG